MNEINKYIESAFKGLPITDDILDIKQNILDSSHDCYNDSIANGLSHTQAMEKVKLKFGNIDELKLSLGLPLNNKTAKKQAKPKRTHKFRAFNITKLQLDVLIVTLCLFSIVYLVLGMFSMWSTGWVWLVIGIFTSVIISEFFIMHNCKKDIEFYKQKFTFEMSIALMSFACIFYLFFGVYFGKWHPYWIVFPIFASLCIIPQIVIKLIYKRNQITHIVGSFCGLTISFTIIIYLILAFKFSLWHPLWVIIPIVGFICGIIELTTEIVQSQKKKSDK